MYMGPLNQSISDKLAGVTICSCLGGSKKGSGVPAEISLFLIKVLTQRSKCSVIEFYPEVDVTT